MRRKALDSSNYVVGLTAVFIYIRALVCGGQMEQEGRSRMVKMSLVLVGLRAWSR